MKNSIIFFYIIGFILNLSAQTLQVNVRETGSHFMDLNTIQLEDGTKDIIIAGTKFNPAFNDKRAFLMRMEEDSGNTLWEKYYENLNESSGFDITRFNDGTGERIALTGYISNGTNFMYIAIIDPANGNEISQQMFQIETFPNNYGLKIIYTEAPINGIPTPGFMVVGMSNTVNDMNTANSHKGFVVRTDLSLNSLWERTINSSGVTKDYDVASGVIETNNGFFVYGSITQTLSGDKQAIAVTKLDFDGNLQWNNSYFVGNSIDNAADAFYESSTDELYLLCNISFSHQFAIVKLNNTTGNLINFYTYQESSGDLDHYGFKIDTSHTNANELIVFGYDRETQIAFNGAVVQSENVPFSVVIDKNTGIASQAQYYHVPFLNSASNTDHFRLFKNQFPQYYYPDMAVTLIDKNYLILGYRSFSPSTTTAVEALFVTNDFIIDCEQDGLNFTLQTPTPDIQNYSVTNSFVTNNSNPSIVQNITEQLDLCQGGNLGLENFNKTEIKLYPNPATKVVKLSKNNIIAFEVFDQTGKQIIQGTKFPQDGLNISGLSKGIYFVKLETKEAVIHIKKLIKY